MSDPHPQSSAQAPKVRFWGKGGAFVTLSMPCAVNGCLWFRKTSRSAWAPRLRALLRFQAPQAFNQDVDAYGLDENALRRLRAQPGLAQHLNALIESTQWTVSLSAGVLSVTGKAAVFRKTSDKQPWFAAMSGLASSLETTPHLELRGGLPVVSKATGAALIVVSAVLMLAVFTAPAPRLFSVDTLWPAAFGVGTVLLVTSIAVFSLLVRNNPFAWTFAPTAISYAVMFSMMLSMTGANALNGVLPSGDEQTVVVTGWLQQTRGRHGPAYAIASADHAPISAFGVHTERIFLNYREYTDLLGRDRIMDGRFEITVNKGWLGMPYIEHVRRIDSTD
jgi:hypothetical protein